MWSGTQIHELALLIKADGLLVRQVLNQLHLIRLGLFLHGPDRLIPWQHKWLNRKIFLYDLCHLSFQLLQILRRESALPVKIIVKPVVNGWSDCQLCLRIQPLHCLCQHVGCCVADGP